METKRKEVVSILNLLILILLDILVSFVLTNFTYMRNMLFSPIEDDYILMLTLKYAIVWAGRLILISVILYILWLNVNCLLDLFESIFHKSKNELQDLSLVVDEKSKEKDPDNVVKRIICINTDNINMNGKWINNTWSIIFYETKILSITTIPKSVFEKDKTYTIELHPDSTDEQKKSFDRIKDRYTIIDMNCNDIIVIFEDYFDRCDKEQIIPPFDMKLELNKIQEKNLT